VEGMEKVEAGYVGGEGDTVLRKKVEEVEKKR
jgi:hypothetical protein